MPVEVQGHQFEPAPNNRMRDAKDYRCTICGKVVRVYSRTLKPLAERLNEKVSPCSGPKC